MNRMKHVCVACAIAVASMVTASGAAAQQASLTGVVVDALGARVPGATVTLSGEGQASRDTTSAADGGYSFTAVPAGQYQITAAAPGFEPYTSEPIYLSSTARQKLDVTLQVGPLRQAVVVTAGATQVLQAQTGAPVTVIDSTIIDALNKPDVLESLRLVPGAQVTQTGARGGEASLLIRGGNSNFNKVLIDGAVANDIGGGFDLAQLSTVGIDRIEVMRQTNSVIYGSDALAGVVSVTTRRGRSRIPQVTYAADGGNLGTWSSEAGIGGMVRRFDYFSSYRHFDTDNDVPNNAYRNDTYAGRFGVTIGSRTDVSGTLRATHTDFGSPNGVLLYGLADDSNSKNELLYSSLTANSQLTNRWQSTVRFGSTGLTTHFTNPAPTGEAFDPFGFGANYIGHTVHLTGANGYSVSGRAILDYGGLYPSTSESRMTRRTLSGQTTYEVNGSLSVSGGARYEREQGYDDPSGEPIDSRNNGGAFVEARAALANRHYVSGGVGVEHNEVFGNAWTPRISIASYVRQSPAAAIGDTKIVVNAGTGIKAPSVFQSQYSLYALVTGTPAGAGVEPVGPERSRSFDVGVEQSFARGRARARAAYFHNTFRDLLEYLGQTQLIVAGVPPAAAASPAAQFGAYVNSQSYRAQGMELSLEAQPRNDVRMSASYTYLDADVTRALSASESFNDAFPGMAIGAYSPLVGARPFRRPANSGTLMVMYTPGRAAVALSAYFAGKRDDSTFLSDQYFGNSLLLPNRDLDAAYQKVDLSGSYRLHPRIRGFVSIENLLNQDYQASFGFPALPITARVGFRLTFGGDGASHP